MTRAAYVGVENFARNVKSIYVGVEDTARSVVKGYVGDENGIARQFWPPKRGGGGSFDFPPYEPPVYPPIIPENNVTCEHCDESCHGWLWVPDWHLWHAVWNGSSWSYVTGDPPAYYNQHYSIKFCLKTRKILGYIEHFSVSYPGGELPDYAWTSEYYGMTDCNDTQHKLPYIPGVWWWGNWRRGDDGYYYVDLPSDNSVNTSNNSADTRAMYDPDNFTEDNADAVLQNAQLNNPMADVDLEPI
jgi:hypothetical protein